MGILYNSMEGEYDSSTIGVMGGYIRYWCKKKESTISDVEMVESDSIRHRRSIVRNNKMRDGYGNSAMYDDSDRVSMSVYHPRHVHDDMNSNIMNNISNDKRITQKTFRHVEDRSIPSNIRPSIKVSQLQRILSIYRTKYNEDINNNETMYNNKQLVLSTLPNPLKHKIHTHDRFIPHRYPHTHSDVQSFVRDTIRHKYDVSSSRMQDSSIIIHNRHSRYVDGKEEEKEIYEGGEKEKGESKVSNRISYDASGAMGNNLSKITGKIIRSNIQSFGPMRSEQESIQDNNKVYEDKCVQTIEDVDHRDYNVEIPVDSDSDGHQACEAITPVSTPMKRYKKNVDIVDAHVDNDNNPSSVAHTDTQVLVDSIKDQSSVTMIDMNKNNDIVHNNNSVVQTLLDVKPVAAIQPPQNPFIESMKNVSSENILLKSLIDNSNQASFFRKNTNNTIVNEDIRPFAPSSNNNTSMFFTNTSNSNNNINNTSPFFNINNISSRNTNTNANTATFFNNHTSSSSIVNNNNTPFFDRHKIDRDSYRDNNNNNNNSSFFERASNNGNTNSFLSNQTSNNPFLTTNKTSANTSLFQSSSNNNNTTNRTNGYLKITRNNQKLLHN